MRRPFRTSLRPVESIESTTGLSLSTKEDFSSPAIGDQRMDKQPTISTITAFIKLTEADFEKQSEYAFSAFPVLGTKIDTVVTRLKELEHKFKEKGYNISSLRIATNPFCTWLLQNDNFVLAERLEFLDSLLQRHGIFGCSLGPAKNVSELACVRQIIAASEKFHCFFTLDGKDFAGASKAIEVIYDISSLDPLGLANTRFCVAAKTCQPWNPFFPMAYYDEQIEEMETTIASEHEVSTERERNHHGLVVRFAIGLENGYLTHHLLNMSGCIENIDTVFRQGMIEALMPIQQISENFCSIYTRNGRDDAKSMRKIKEIDNAFYGTMIHALFPPGLDLDYLASSQSGMPLSKLPTPMRFMGIDTTIRFPFKTSSLVLTLECLKDIDEFGDCETFVACTAIRNVLQSLDGIHSTGFCGISLPVCSDVRFIELIESATSPRHLLNITSVCGNGVDMVCDLRFYKILGVVLTVLISMKKNRDSQ